MIHYAITLGLLLGCGIACHLRADDITIDGAAHLTGTVRSIDATGSLELVSELSPEPLLVKSSAVAKVVFSAKGPTLKASPALLELTNGDLIPSSIETLDERQLMIASPDAGRIAIPREALKSLQLGVRNPQVIYAGPRNLDEWTGGEGEKQNWIFKRGALAAKGPALASMKLTLPQQFILTFTLKWQPKQAPNFQIFFADPLKKTGEACDRYYLQFSTAGLEIKREAANDTGKRYHTLKLLDRTPNQYADQRLQVELRVDRQAARMQVLLNGESEGEFADPVPSLPAGSGIALACNAQNGGQQEISGIQVLEFTDSRKRHHAEERGDSKSDCMISREDDRWAGSLTDLQLLDGVPVFRFKSDSQKDLLEMPLTDISTVFFAAKPMAKPDLTLQSFTLRLRDDGLLHVSSCLFTEDSVSVIHPMLGRMNINRAGIVSMERTKTHSKTAPKP